MTKTTVPVTYHSRLLLCPLKKLLFHLNDGFIRTYRILKVKPVFGIVYTFEADGTTKVEIENRRLKN
ncbi:hypothetical protein GQX74_007116 [Glossina fuscipes]|nr:hypothetical protein GQX74_007116 [Glossina fuscipes]